MDTVDDEDGSEEKVVGAVASSARSSGPGPGLSRACALLAVLQLLPPARDVCQCLGVRALSAFKRHLHSPSRCCLAASRKDQRSRPLLSPRVRLPRLPVTLSHVARHLGNFHGDNERRRSIGDAELLKSCRRCTGKWLIVECVSPTAFWGLAARRVRSRLLTWLRSLAQWLTARKGQFVSSSTSPIGLDSLARRLDE